MREAETILSVIRERGRRGLPLERVYRLLFNPNLYLKAYAKIHRNEGAMTPGSTEETADGMSVARIEAIIGALRRERYRWSPARRVYIEKPNSKKKRPLGLPTFSDKLLQEVIRLILEAHYEPQFGDRSHGFRSGRGCHTTLMEIRQTWTGTSWFIEGDVSDCFGSLDHGLLLDILREKIHDGRFLRLIENLLKAGYLEDWRFNRTLSGSPQGGIVSPILTNVYLDRLDNYVEKTLLPKHNRGTRRRANPEYDYLRFLAKRLAREGDEGGAKKLDERRRNIPSQDPNDPDYRRLRYIRYADDFLLGFAGPREEAREIKSRLKEFLRDELKLELSEEKTLITHARTEAARFLGYELVVFHDDHKHDRTGRRSINGNVGLKVPADVVRAKSAPYLKGGKPIHRCERVNDSAFSIVAQYQKEFRGVAEYYRLAHNLSTRLNRLKWVMELSLAKTLARKLRVSVSKVYGRYGSTIQTEQGTYKVLKVTVKRKGKKPLVATWGGIPLTWRKHAILDDQPQNVWNARTELLERLLADSCELCGSREYVQVHHLRSLKDLRRKGRAEKPEWVKAMAARQRKTLVVCRKCHQDIHAGRHSGDAKISGPTRHRRAT
ncbi:MAG: reverse transcriptase domain-containing protein [Gemmatimonadaceae bacterium]|nr:maturase [Actinomycetota bacterium]